MGQRDCNGEKQEMEIYLMWPHQNEEQRHPGTPCGSFSFVLVIKYSSERQFKGLLWFTIPGHRPMLWRKLIEFIVKSRKKQKHASSFACLSQINECTLLLFGTPYLGNDVPIVGWGFSYELS